MGLIVKPMTPKSKRSQSTQRPGGPLPDRTGVSVKDYITYVSGRATDFGMEGYKVASTDLNYTSKSRSTRIVQNKIPAYVDKIIKDKLWVPPSNKYQNFIDWSKQPELFKKDHFSKLARVTFTEGITKDKTVKEWPSPHTYKAPSGDFDGKKKLNNPKGSDRTCAFITEAQFLATQSPSPAAFKKNFVSHRQLISIIDESRP